MFWRKKRKLTRDNYHIEVDVNFNAPEGSEPIKIEFREVDHATLRKLKAAERLRNDFAVPLSIPSTDQLRREIILGSNSPFFPPLDPKTTQKVRTALAESMDAGEPITPLKERLGKLLTDAKMIEDIAYTESVYAYSAANVRFGELSRAIGKEWNTIPGCCDDCAALHDKKVPIRSKFSAKDKLGHPPLHHQCRCRIRIMHSNEKSKLSPVS